MHNGGGPKGCVYNRTLEVYVQKNMQKKCQVELQLDAEMVERNKTLEEKGKEEKDDDDDEDTDSSVASTYTCHATVSVIFYTLLSTHLRQHLVQGVVKTKAQQNEPTVSVIDVFLGFFLKIFVGNHFIFVTADGIASQHPSTF